MDGTSSFPSRPEMERNLATFVERTGLQVRFDTPLGVDRDATASASCCTRPTASTAARSRSSRSASPSHSRPTRPASSTLRTTSTRDRRRRTPASGCSSSARRTRGFELATGLLQWAQRIVLASPRPAKLSRQLPLAGRRPRALRPAVRGPDPRRRRVHPQRLDRAHRADRATACACTASARRTARRSPSTRTRSSPRPASLVRSSDLPAIGVDGLRPQPAAGDDQLLGERDRARASTSPAPSARACRA